MKKNRESIKIVGEELAGSEETGRNSRNARSKEIVAGSEGILRNSRSSGSVRRK